MSSDPPRDDDEPLDPEGPPSSNPPVDPGAPPVRESGPAPYHSTDLNDVLRGGSTPSFFPEGEEDLDAYLDQLLPSLAPPSPALRESGSGLRLSYTELGSGLSTSLDDVSQVVALHDEPVPARIEDPATAFSSSDALSLLALDERGADMDGAAPVDEAALATLTSLERRTPRAPVNPIAADGNAGLHARAQLLEALAHNAEAAPVQTRLLSYAAELWDRCDEPERARELRQRAAACHALDLYALRELRRDALHALDFAGAAELLDREARLSIPDAERSLVLTALAELRLRSLGDLPGALDAALAALQASPGALSAAILAHELQLANGKLVDAADALHRGAEGVHDRPLRAGLESHSGRALLRAGDPTRARARFEQALAHQPDSTEALLGLYRAARATRDPASAARCLTQLAQALPEGSTRRELTRRRAALELWAMNDPESALASFVSAEDFLAVRGALVAAEQTGATEARVEALNVWISHGGQRALGLLELARAEADRGQVARAAELLEQAADLDPDLPLIRVAQQQLARQRGDADSLAAAVGEHGERNRLGAAAKLGASPAHAVRERELLLLARTDLDDKATTEALLVDAAAEAGDLDAVRRGLWGRAERGSASRRVGPLTALLDLHEATAESEAVREILRTGLRATAGSTPMLRQALAAEHDVEARAALWRAEAARVPPERAAFAVTMAAHELATAGSDAAGAYEAALGLSPSHGPAAWALEHTARRAGYSDALVRVHEALAECEPDRLERRSRRIRTGLLYASTNPGLASEYLYEALELDPADPIVADLLQRLGIGGNTARVAEAQLRATASSSRDTRRAGTLRAAELFLGAGENERAVALYRTLIAELPTDLLARRGLELALHALARPAELLEWLTTRAAEASGDAARRLALEQLARGKLRAGQLDDGILALEQLLSLAPADVATLRELSRLAMLSDRKLALGRYAEAMATQLEDAGDRSAELWQALRLREVSKPRELEALDPLIERLTHEGRGDLWAALVQEDLARRSGRPHAVADALARVERTLSDPDERASLAMRAAEVLEPASVQSALDALEEQAGAAPDHPLVQEELGRLCEHAGRLEDALTAFTRAAQRARSDERRLRLWYRVALLAQDRLGAAAQACIALEEVVALDVLYREAFSRLRHLYESNHDARALIRLFERRLQRGAASGLVAELNTEICRLALSLGDRATAKHALTAAMEADPERVETQQALAALHLSDGDHRAAADVLVRLARSAKDPSLLLSTFRELGALYDGPLPDLKRAEIAFTRVLGLDPEDSATVERLASVFDRSGQAQRALRAWQLLAERHADDPERWERYSLEQARQLERSGDSAGAERLLDQVRATRPTSLPAVRALTEHYARQGAQPSVLVHLDRSIHAFRSAVREQPGSREAWLGLIETLEARHHPRAAASCRFAARSLGVTDIAAPGQVPQGLRERSRSSEAAHRALPKRLNPALRGLLAAAAPAMDRVAPYSGDGSSNRSLRSLGDAGELAREVAAWFGLPAPAIRTCAQPVCIPVLEQPFTLVIGEQLLTRLEHAELTYVMARATAQAAEHLTLLARAQPEALDLTLRALLWHLDPARPRSEHDQEAVERVAAELAPRLQGTEAQLATGARELTSGSQIDVLGLNNLALEVGARAALLATADLGAALRAIARCGGTGVEAASLLDLVRDDAEANDLLYFAVSDQYFAALEEAAE